MNEVINGDILSELHLTQPRFTYDALGSFTKHRERIEKNRESGYLNHLHLNYLLNELDKACFAHDATYSDSKDLTKRTISDKLLKDRAYKITRTRKCDGYQRALASMVYNFFIRT